MANVEHDEKSFVIDTKPIPVVGYRRSKKHSDFDGSASAKAKQRYSRQAAVCVNALRYCAARKMSARHAASRKGTAPSGQIVVFDDWDALRPSRMLPACDPQLWY